MDRSRDGAAAARGVGVWPRSTPQPSDGRWLVGGEVYTPHEPVLTPPKRGDKAKAASAAAAAAAAAAESVQPLQQQQQQQQHQQQQHQQQQQQQQQQKSGAPASHGKAAQRPHASRGGAASTFEVARSRRDEGSTAEASAASHTHLSSPREDAHAVTSPITSHEQIVAEAAANAEVAAAAAATRAIIAAAASATSAAICTAEEMAELIRVRRDAWLCSRSSDPSLVRHVLRRAEEALSRVDGELAGFDEHTPDERGAPRDQLDHGRREALQQARWDAYGELLESRERLLARIALAGAASESHALPPVEVDPLLHAAMHDEEMLYLSNEASGSLMGSPVMALPFTDADGGQSDRELAHTGSSPQSQRPQSQRLGSAMAAVRRRR
jgi:hypothetical protein